MPLEQGMTFRATVGGTDVVRCEVDARSDLQGHRRLRELRARDDADYE